MRLACALWPVLVVALAHCPRAFADAAETSNEVWSRLARIESAFREGDAFALRSSLSSSGKIRVDLDGLTEGPASYGAGQLQVIFGEIFAGSKTREFSFRRNEVNVPGAGAAFARGHWVRSHGGREVSDTLTFTLRNESGDWRIVEIRSSR